MLWSDNARCVLANSGNVRARISTVRAGTVVRAGGIQYVSPGYETHGLQAGTEIVFGWPHPRGKRERCTHKNIFAHDITAETGFKNFQRDIVSRTVPGPNRGPNRISSGADDIVGELQSQQLRIFRRISDRKHVAKRIREAGDVIDAYVTQPVRCPGIQ